MKGTMIQRLGYYSVLPLLFLAFAGMPAPSFAGQQDGYHIIDETHRFYKNPGLSLPDLLFDFSTDDGDGGAPGGAPYPEPGQEYRLQLDGEDWFFHERDMDVEEYDLWRVLRSPSLDTSLYNTSGYEPEGAEDRAKGGGYVSVAFGVFSPGDELSDDWGDGLDFSISLLGFFKEHWAFDLVFHAFGTGATIYSNSVPRDHSLLALGFEALISFEPSKSRVQPFVAAGLGAYTNYYRIEENGEEVFNEYGNAIGAVFKAGVRLFVTERLFVSFFGKYFSDVQLYDYPGGTDTIDFGGTVLGCGTGLSL